MSSQSQVSERVESAQADPLADMVFVPGGEFRMGPGGHYPEEAPAHRVRVGAFWIDPAPVTNRQFRRFVNATKHVTFAEIAPKAEDYPGALPHMLKAGSLVFSPPKEPVDLSEYAIGFHVARMIADGGTLQIGIGQEGDAAVHAMILRQPCRQ